MLGSPKKRLSSGHVNWTPFKGPVQAIASQPVLPQFAPAGAAEVVAATTYGLLTLIFPTAFMPG